MASAIEHYRQAEASQEAAVDAESRDEPALARLNLQHALVHATLALAGATALNAYSDGQDAELEEWQETAGGDT